MILFGCPNLSCKRVEGEGRHKSHISVEPLFKEHFSLAILVTSIQPSSRIRDFFRHPFCISYCIELQVVELNEISTRTSPMLSLNIPNFSLISLITERRSKFQHGNNHTFQRIDRSAGTRVWSRGMELRFGLYDPGSPRRSCHLSCSKITVW